MPVVNLEVTILGDLREVFRTLQDVDFDTRAMTFTYRELELRKLSLQLVTDVSNFLSGDVSHHGSFAVLVRYRYSQWICQPAKYVFSKYYAKNQSVIAPVPK